jgi:RNA polymerase sigma factor (sigma-70 family)
VSPPRTDVEAWNAALAGDGAAFAEIFDRHEQRIRRHSRRLVPSPEDANDVVGITFLEAWRRRDSVRFVNGSLLAWLLVTATNTARNMSRATRRYQRVLERIPPSPHAPDPADLVETGPAVQALRTLSRRHQDVVALCVLQGFSTGDAAAALGIAEGTVKSRLHWAKRRLADRMELTLVERTA